MEITRTWHLGMAWHLVNTMDAQVNKGTRPSPLSSPLINFLNNSCSLVPPPLYRRESDQSQIYCIIKTQLEFFFSLQNHRLKGRLDENREIVLYSNRPCLHTLISLPLANSYPSLPSPYLNQPKANSHLLPGTMPHLIELSLSLLYLEPVSHLDTIYITYLIFLTLELL